VLRARAVTCKDPTMGLNGAAHVPLTLLTQQV
jgi:hypothetical protein